MKRYIFILLVFTSTAAYTNDSRMVMGGTPTMADDKNTNVTMQKETINIRLHKDFYEVDVTFIFFNDGADETILLGFPVEERSLLHYAIPYNYELLTEFNSYINDELITQYEVKEEILFHEEYKQHYYRRWYIRQVLFPANSKTVSRVVYKVPYSNHGFYVYAGYIYGTGYNWKGSIGEMDINIEHDDNLYIKSLTMDGFEKDEILRALSRDNNGRINIKHTNVNPNKDDRIRFFITRITNLQEVQSYTFCDLVGCWAWESGLVENLGICSFTTSQLDIFINFFYARHGFEFKDEYFNNIYKQTYFEIPNVGIFHYSVNPDFSENLFNENERKNIEYLRNLKSMIKNRGAPEIEYFFEVKEPEAAERNGPVEEVKRDTKATVLTDEERKRRNEARDRMQFNNVISLEKKRESLEVLILMFGSFASLLIIMVFSAVFFLCKLKK